ncbi:MAG: ArsC/Spx/MgsR family protein [Sediminicola sp.]
MKKIYYLSTCDTCKRIMAQLSPLEGFELQDIKAQGLDAGQLETLKKGAGSYEALFNKRARLYKERDLSSKNLGEADYKDLLLEHYTFLKRPVILVDGQLFVGNSATTVAAAKKAIHP